MLAVPFTALTVVVIINVGLGAMNTLAASGMNKIEVPEGPLLSPVAFRHPFVQTLVMMIGEASCLAAFALLYWRKPNGPSPWRGGLLFFAIPSICDWCGTTMMYAALSDLPGSVVQMMRGSCVIFVFLISVVIFRHKQYKHHYVGVLIVAIGITLVGLSAMLAPAPTNIWDSLSRNPKKTSRGVSLCVASQVMAAFLVTSEERILKKIHTPAILAIGVEGTCGVLIGGIVLAVTAASGIEHPRQAAYQIFHSGSLAATGIFLCASIAIINSTGMQITKKVSAMAKSVADLFRVMLVWVGDVALGWSMAGPSEFAFWLQPIGFAVVTVGTLIFFNSIAIPALMGPDELVEHQRLEEGALLAWQEMEGHWESGIARDDHYGICSSSLDVREINDDLLVLPNRTRVLRSDVSADQD
eukprot:GEMP01039091.1.p1 GENE.GEMP01039091.1~~GEMP01039091.1.p1  ORF type:complete len:413 (+),score=74.59 GEMP01039091.1:369-1607(+)